jgi:hypothetical protein
MRRARDCKKNLGSDQNGSKRIIELSIFLIRFDPFLSEPKPLTFPRSPPIGFYYVSPINNLPKIRAPAPKTAATLGPEMKNVFEQTTNQRDQSHQRK